MSARFQVELSGKWQIAETLYKLEFEVPQEHPFEFEAGQFMSILVEGFVRRSYSLANPPQERDKLITYIDTIPQGPGSRFAERVNIGDKVDILAPLGYFLYIPEKERPVYFFATGTGITPFFSMIRHELEELKSGRKIVLHYGVKFEEELIEIEMLNKLVQDYPNFELHTYVSRSDEWQGNKGRMTTYINQGIPADIDAYLCGGIEMIQDVEQLLVAQGVQGSRIYYERFY